MFISLKAQTDCITIRTSVPAKVGKRSFNMHGKTPEEYDEDVYSDDDDDMITNKENIVSVINWLAQYQRPPSQNLRRS